MENSERGHFAHARSARMAVLASRLLSAGQEPCLSGAVQGYVAVPFSQDSTASIGAHIYFPKALFLARRPNKKRFRGIRDTCVFHI